MLKHNRFFDHRTTIFFMYSLIFLMRFFCLLFFLLGWNSLLAQQAMSRSRPLSSWGSSAEFIQLGISAAARKLPENNFYHPLLFSYHAEWLHSDTVFSSPFLSTSWVAELFFSPARFSSNKELFSTVEFGALGGIQLQWNFSSKCSAYTQIVA